MTEFYALIVFGDVYSTHDNVWSAREAWYNLGEKSRRDAKIVKCSVVEEIDPDSLSLSP